MHCISLPSSHHPLPSPPKTTFKLTCHVVPRMSLDNNNNSRSNGFNIINNISKLLWGPSLPPGLLISTVRTVWTSTWQIMMSQLAPSDPSGGYTRPPSKFRLSHQNPTASTTKLHLYVGLPCPWAHRTLIVRAIKGLEEAVPVSVAAPGLDGSWEFKDIPDKDKSRDKDILVPSRDKVNGCQNLKEVYRLRKGGYNGRATVPLLWDVDKKEVVCNESYDIIEFFNSGLNGLAQNPGLDLSPVELKGKIEEWNRAIYPNVNNGVYRCGFAQSQEAYDVAVNGLFSTLDRIDDHLGGSRYLCGDRLTLADICLFTTLIRFDLVYNVLFKCTKKKLLEFTNLHAYMRDIYQIPKVAATCNFPVIMDGYYQILFPLNPGSIRPVMPIGCEHKFLSRPHNRESMSSVGKSVQYVL
ncbi:PREDICTED: glutathionyl-hydroquinone reductase YqjG [Theobroma cacao]|uniref:Glutathionyl-hydroquinone reductase YqjG n=1 Tax=Theobroma cacao TaxID=3641 RepID=A0AB32VQX8_THECC|nr:PREDICTED: glutathionyl-hydroquinone reductase YqjG [Theobroma cacao]